MTTTPAESPVRAFAARKSGEALQSYRFALGGVAPGEVSVAAFPLIEGKNPAQRDWFERNPRHAPFSAEPKIVPAIEQHPMKDNRVRANRVRYRAVLANEN